MQYANLLEEKDLNYKNGYVQCVCGWRKELGNGFNGYHIDHCPKCTPELETRSQRKVTTGSRKTGYTVTIGNHVYFVIKDCIHVLYSETVYQTYTGLTIRQADAL